MPLSPRAVFSRRSGVDSRPISHGAVIVNMTSGMCFELNSLGAEIWKLLARGASEASICAALSGRYDVAPEILTADVRSLLGELARHGLVDATEPQGSPK